MTRGGLLSDWNTSQNSKQACIMVGAVITEITPNGHERIKIQIG